MSSVKLGGDVEQLAARTLRRLGYAVHVAGRDHGGNYRIRYSHDLFDGLFDLVAVDTTGVRFVQVKASKRRPDASWREKVAALPTGGLTTDYEWWRLNDLASTWEITSCLSGVWREWTCKV